MSGRQDAPRFGEWHPMSKQARDEAPVLVSAGGIVGEADCVEFGRRWHWMVGKLCDPQPTHWMPLPAAVEDGP